jgi:cell division septation protein DedD
VLDATANILVKYSHLRADSSFARVWSVAYALIKEPDGSTTYGGSRVHQDKPGPRPHDEGSPDEAPETPTTEPQPTPVQDPPAEPDPAPYVVGAMPRVIYSESRT